MGLNDILASYGIKGTPVEIFLQKHFLLMQFSHVVLGSLGNYPSVP